MLTFLILIAVLALAAFVLHYGYKLAFYYTDPNASPYAYGTDEQITACKAVLDDCIAEFDAAPFEQVQIQSRDGLTLYGNGGYVMYNERVNPGTGDWSNYIPGYGFGVLAEGDLLG